MGKVTVRRHLAGGSAAFAFVLATLCSISLWAQSKVTVLPEMILAIDTSESMQLSIADGKKVDCSIEKPAATRWTAVQQMLTGSITDYKCVKESLPSFPDSLVTPKQVVGAKVCIGGLDHFISTRTAANMPAKQAAGDKSYSGSFLSPHTQLRLLISKEDIVLPYFSYELDGISTTDKWVEGDLRLVTKDVSTVNSGDIWGYLVRMDKNPALMNGKVFICDLMTQTKGGVVTGPTKLNNTSDGETLFKLNADALVTLQDDVKKGQKTFFFAVVSQKAWFKTNCSARGDDMTEKMDIKFHGHGSPWKDRRPRLEVGTGVQCPREGPGAHFSAVGSAGVDGLLSTYVDAAKYALMVSDVSMSKATDAAGDFSFGDALGTYWGEINIGMQDPFATGSQSFPIVRSDDSKSRLNGIDTIRKRIQSIQPHGGTPLGSFLQDISGYFGPGKYQDAHFQSSQADPKSGDPYFECRGRMVVLFTDGGANLHTGISDGRSAALQAAADLWTKGIALYVVVPGSKSISDTDLDFLDELALAGGTSKAWRVDTALALNARLKTILQTVGTTGEVLTPTVMTSSTGSDEEVQHSFHARSNFDVTEPMQTWGILEQRIFGCSASCVDEKSPGSAKVCEVIDYGQRLKDRQTPRALYSHVRGVRTDLDERNISADDMLISKTGLAPQLELDGNNNCVTKPNTFKLSSPSQRSAYAADVLSQIRGDGKSCRVNHLLGAP
ncbi:MAG TPA: hypothetical protein DCQ06_10700, partial [Myxococcales bacterium]|nr:hypothetical protein [Myxococcales bacterium]